MTSAAIGEVLNHARDLVSERNRDIAPTDSFRIRRNRWLPFRDTLRTVQGSFPGVRLEQIKLLNDVLTRAAEDQKTLRREIMAHRVSAEYHRHRNMVLGGWATVLTTVIGTAVFTGLVSQFGLDGKSTGKSPGPVNPFQVWGGIWLYGVALFLSVLAPVVAALYSFMHNAEDAASHQASVAGYSRVLCRLTIFLAKYGPDTPSEKTDEVLNAYNNIMNDHASVLEKSLTLTTQAFQRADELMGIAPERPWWKIWL